MKQEIQNIWNNNITLEILKSLIGSMLRRLEKVIKMKGATIEV
jgi:hypothetical protein